MTIHEASRTLLKSPPELWAECSDATSLSRHLDQFGEIKITRLEPETAVAWEGKNVSGTVKLEPSGWGTRVILTAEEIDPVIEAESGPSADPAPEPEPEPIVAAEPELPSEPEPTVAAEPEPPSEPEPTVAPEPELPSEPELTVAAEPEPPAEAPKPQSEPEPKIGLFARIFGRKRKLTWPQVEHVAAADTPVTVDEPEPVIVDEPEPVMAAEPHGIEPVREPPAGEPTATAAPEPAGRDPEPEAMPAEPVTEPTQPAADATIRALTDALESLGMAHHRPFSRS